MAGWKWQRPGWTGADGDRDKNQQQGQGGDVPPPTGKPADPRTGWHYVTSDGRISGPFASQQEAQEAAFNRRVPQFTVCAPAPRPAPEPEPEAVLPVPDEEADPTTGWHYTDKGYPDEGACGPFATAGEAAMHAAEVYPDGGFDLHPPVVRKEATDGGA